MTEPEISRAQLDAVDQMLRALDGIEAVFIPAGVPKDAPIRVQVSICTLLGLLAQRDPRAVAALRATVAAVAQDEAFWQQQHAVAAAAAK